MSEERQFDFQPEGDISSPPSRPPEKFGRVLIYLSLAIVIIGVGFTSFVKRQHDLPNRELQSIPPPPLPAVNFDSFLVRMKSNTGFRLTKVELVFRVSSSEVSEEIQKSVPKIKDHLVFILSKKDISIFSDPQKRVSLKEEIIDQLNLFLTDGEIRTVKVTETFLK